MPELKIYDTALAEPTATGKNLPQRLPTFMLSRTPHQCNGASAEELRLLEVSQETPHGVLRQGTNSRILLCNATAGSRHGECP